MSPESWIGVGMAGIALLGTIANGIIGWLTKRDQLRNDVTTALQQAEIVTLKASSQKCQEMHTETQAKLNSCEEMHRSTESRIKKLENKN